MNKAFLIGRLTKDIEVKSTQSGKAVTSFTLAVDRRNKDDGADFINCVAWGNTAEVMGRYLSKGRKIALEGHISVRSYDARDGKRYVTEVIADQVEFLDRAQERPKPVETVPVEPVEHEEFVDIDDDGELPF